MHKTRYPDRLLPGQAADDLVGQSGGDEFVTGLRRVAVVQEEALILSAGDAAVFLLEFSLEEASQVEGRRVMFAAGGEDRLEDLRAGAGAATIQAVGPAELTRAESVRPRARRETPSR